jgi:pyrroline-5-carboxylate reductase
MLGFIGAGKMAEAIFAGLLRKGDIAAAEIIVSDISQARVAQLVEKYGVQGEVSSKDLVVTCDPIVLSVKPQNMDSVLDVITGKVHDRCVVSIAAGIETTQIEKRLAGTSVVRVMPNLACQVGEGMSVICGGAYATEEDVLRVEDIFSASGRVCRAPETLFDMVTAVSGSGPAFWTQLAQYQTSKAVEAGMDPSVARELVIQTMAGTAKVLGEQDLSFENFMDSVASKGGTTAAGLAVLRSSAARHILHDVLDAAARRSYELRS